MLKEVQNKLINMDVTKLTEKKNKLTYLSWAKAWRIILEEYPDATYSIRKNPEGTPEFGNSKFGYMVYTDVTIEGITREMWLFVMDGANKSLKDEPYTYLNSYGKEKTAAAISMFDINKTVMRCLVKNLAMFGLGLYIYAGEDLPDAVDGPDAPKAETTTETPKKVKPEDIIAIAKQKGYEGDALCKKIKVNKIDDIKFLKADRKVEVYNKLLELDDK